MSDHRYYAVMAQMEGYAFLIYMIGAVVLIGLDDVIYTVAGLYALGLSLWSLYAAIVWRKKLRRMGYRLVTRSVVDVEEAG